MAALLMPYLDATNDPVKRLCNRCNALQLLVLAQVGKLVHGGKQVVELGTSAVQERHAGQHSMRVNPQGGAAGCGECGAELCLCGKTLGRNKQKRTCNTRRMKTNTIGVLIQQPHCILIGCNTLALGAAEQQRLSQWYN